MVRVQATDRAEVGKKKNVLAENKSAMNGNIYKRSGDAKDPKISEVKLAKPKKKAISARKARKKPSFLDSTPMRPSVIGLLKKTRKSKNKGRSGGSGGGFTKHAETSAGLPGNEHIDPPKRTSSSTPMSRWRDQIGIKSRP